VIYRLLNNIFRKFIYQLLKNINDQVIYLLKNISSDDLSIAQEYFSVSSFINCSRILSIRWFICSRIFLHQVIYQLLKNIIDQVIYLRKNTSSSGDLSVAQEYFWTRWFIRYLITFLSAIPVLFTVTIHSRTGNDRINMHDELRRLWNTVT
jgi:hypothetical protein